MSRKWQISLGIMLLATFVLLGGFGLYLYSQAGRIIYYKYGFAHWQEKHPAACTPYRQSYFNNLIPGQDSGQALELSCEQALELKAQSHFVTTPDPLKIHYRVFDGKTNQPLLLHVPGITSDWLNGARYYKAAQRMGFQLVVMEMRGHGDSEPAGQVSYGCKESQDVLAVIQDLVAQYPGRALYLWGSSGGTMAIVNAATALNQIPALKALVLENPISALRDVAEAKSPGLPDPIYTLAIGMASWRAGVDFKQCAPTALARQLQKPVLVTVTPKDNLTPVWMAEKLFASLPAGLKTLKIYPQGDHERIWNGQPQRYEADLKAHYLQAISAD